MKPLFSAAATVLFTTTIAFSAMALTPRTAPTSGTSASAALSEDDSCVNNPDGSTTCCEACGNGHICCVKVGPIQ